MMSRELSGREVKGNCHPARSAAEGAESEVMACARSEVVGQGSKKAGSVGPGFDPGREAPARHGYKPDRL